MKRLLRLFLISIFSLWLVNQWFPQGLVLNDLNLTLIKAGIALTIANYLIRPIFSLIMFPINLLTFGIFRWVTHTFMLWLVIRAVGNISIQPFIFPGADLKFVIIPSLNFNVYTAWIAIPLTISLISGTLIWLVKK